jgi:N6-adenosine-specific RNA methylase IME4
MSIEDIKKIEMPLMNDSVVLLWTTHKFLPDAFDILKEWNLEYKATLVWNKEKIGMGAWFRMQCEFCLVGIKGKPYWNNTTFRDILNEPRREHSRKPDSFFEMIEQITLGRRLEYFSREKRNGWEVFGNDINKF